MSAYADACHRPFSNGTEGEAWMSRWCYVCRYDHDMSHRDGTETNGCPLILASMVDKWPEGWIPEPEDGHFELPSRLVCTRFEPCHEGSCEGDEWPDVRAEVVAEVTAYWKERQ